ncbi:MAG: hypothetical protein ISN28_04360 [Ectothiorhodospiraceae bacterium AqS1]|nr:hypothetical protein [Ectothiorhodospiraceae bacterium AqS1]
MIDIQNSAEFLHSARVQKRALDSIPPEFTPETVDIGYQVQKAMVDRLCVSERTSPVGYKIALTNPAAQTMLGIPHPVYGRLLGSRLLKDRALIAAKDYVSRIVEAEFAFEIALDIPPSDIPYTASSIIDYIGAMHPAIEIADNRLPALSDVSATILAADNAIHGCLVLGDPVDDWQGIDIDLAATEVALEVNDRKMRTGSGKNVLDHPLNALAWLANTLPEYDLALNAGNYVTTGLATDSPFDAQPGDRLRATFEGLGEVSMRFDRSELE